MTGAMGAAEELAGRLNSMPDHPAAAMLTYRSHLLNCAFKAIEDVTLTRSYHLERQIIVVPTYFTHGHASETSLCEVWGVA